MDYTPILNAAMRAAREAGQLAMASVGSPGYLQMKGPRDVVVGSVLPIQERIIDIIHSEFPAHSIIAEEGEVYSKDTGNPLWIVDPLDGSLNFSQGIPYFSISIAFRDENVYRVGVVYDPSRNEMFYAIQGLFARLNDEPITVRQFAEGETAYDNAIIGTDLPGGMKERQKSLNIATLLASQCITLTVMGSPVLGLCYVGAGRLHAYYHTALQLWDIAAASVILSESGGVLTDILGGSWQHSTGGYIASNGVIHGWMLRAAQAVLRHQE
jgi:myo-inositol-1(or 4)-monophosphatase